MPKLKLIVSVGGRENPSIDKDVAMGRGVLVCYTGGAMGDSLPPPPPGNPSMTEMALGMMISVMRGFGVQDRAMRAGEWPGPIGRVLHGKTLGIRRPRTPRRRAGKGLPASRNAGAGRRTHAYA